MAAATADPFDALIDTLAHHQRYHPALVAEFQKLLASSQAAATVQRAFLHRPHTPQQPLPAATLGKQVKRVVNQTLSSLTQWSKVLNSPDSSDVVPREKADAANTLAAATASTALQSTGADSAAAVTARPGTATRTRVAHTLSQRGTQGPGSIKSRTATASKSTGSMATSSNQRSGKTADGSSRGEKKQPVSKAGPSMAALTEPTAQSSISVYATEQPTYNHVAIVVEIGFLSIATLESMDGNLAGSLLEIEKARSNMITKIVHLGMKKRAMVELEVLRERLIKCAKALWNENDFDPKAEGQQVCSIPASQPRPASSSASAETLKKTYQHLFTFQTPKAIQSRSLDASATGPEPIQTFILLVLALFNNAMRCWTDVRNCTMAYLLDDMMSQPESPYDWCLRLGDFKQEAASQQLDAIFRLLFIAAGKATDASVGRTGQQHAFALRIHAMRYHAAYLRMNDTKDPGIIWDKIMRCGAEYDRSTRTGQTQEDALTVVRAYKDIYEFVSGVSAVDRSDAYFRKWHSHFLFFSNKVRRLDYAVKALRKLEDLLQRNHSSLSGNDLEACVSETKDTLLSLGQSLSSFPREGLTSTILMNMARIFRSMDTLRSIGSKIMDRQEKEQVLKTEKEALPMDKQSRSLQYIGQVIRVLADVTEGLWSHGKSDYMLWYNSNPSANPNPTKLSCARVDAILLVFRLHQSGLSMDALPEEKPVLSYLESAYAMAVDMDDMESLHWISNALYNFGGTLFKAGKQREAIRPLVAAIQCLRSSLKDELLVDRTLDVNEAKHSKADARDQLAKRYEILGVCYLAVNELDRALESFNSGLCAMPLSAFLHIDTVASGELKTSQYPAAKLLGRRSRTLLMMEGSRFRSVVTSVPEFDAKMAQAGVPTHMRGIVQEYECGLLSVLSVRGSQLNRRNQDQIEILKHLIVRVYRGGRALIHPIRRARVLVQLAVLYQDGADLALRHEAVNLVKEAIEILKEKDLEHDRDLEPVRNHNLAMAYTWQGILDRQQAENGMIALQLWEMILSKVECFVSAGDSQQLHHRSEVERARNHLPEPELLFEHLRMLADCLGMIDYRVMQVQIYLLMLRLCNGLLPMSENTYADAVRIYSRMGQAYLALGYSGKAKMALNSGKLVLEEMEVSSMDSARRGEVYATWLLAHSLYLTSVGQKTQSAYAYNQARHHFDLYQNRPSLATGHMKLSNGATLSKRVEAKVSWAMILVEASLARSQLLYHEGDLAEAIVDAMRAYRQLCRIVATLSAEVKAAQKDSTSVYQQPLENPFVVQEEPLDRSAAHQPHQQFQTKHERPSAETEQLRQGLELLATQRYQWSIFRLIIETFHHLSTIFLVQGSAREAEFFVQEGKHIAELSRAGKSVDRFRLDQAQLGLRKHMWKESQEILQDLVSQEDASNAGALTWEIHDARIQLLYGDLYFATGRLNRSLEAYYRTDEVLSHLMDKSFISELERLVIREPQTPREKRLAIVYQHQSMSLRHLYSSSSALLPGMDASGGAMDQAQFECVVLSGIKAAMGYRTSLIFGQLGQRVEAHGLIEKSRAEDPLATTAAEYHLAKAKMLMVELEDAMAKHLMYAMIPDSALSVGLFKKTRTQQLSPPPALFTRHSSADNDASLPSSLLMHSPMDLGPVSASPSVRVTRMSRRRRSQLANQVQLLSPSGAGPAGSLETGAQVIGVRKNLTSHYFKILMQAKGHLSEALGHSIKAYPPHVITDICARQAYLAVLESCFHQDNENTGSAFSGTNTTADMSRDSRGDSSLWAMANRAACSLETAKAVTQRREMHGLIKQKLNPTLLQEDQVWPREIQLKNPLHSSSQYSQRQQQHFLRSKKGMQPQRLGRKTVNYTGLEKPRRLQLRMTDDDDNDDDGKYHGEEVQPVAGGNVSIDDEEDETDEDLEAVGMKPEDIKTRRGYRQYLDKQQYIHPSTSLGNERSFLETLERAYDQDLETGGRDHSENFQRDFVDILPDEWTVVSLSMDVEHETLYVNRLRANAMPVVVRLPLNRAQLREGDDQDLGLKLGCGLEFDEEEETPVGYPLSYKDALGELQDILKGSQETLDIGSFSSSLGAATSSASLHGQAPVQLTREIKAEWWNRRQRLDDRLCALLGSMEDQWLCGLKGLIQSHNTPADSENLLTFKRTLEWIMMQAVSSMSSLSTTQGDGIQTAGRPRRGSLVQLEINIELCRVILHLGDQPSFSELKDLIYFLVDAYLYKSVSAPSTPTPPFTAPGAEGMEGTFEPESPSSSAGPSSSSVPYIEYSDLQFGRIAVQIKRALRCYWLAETEAKNNGFDEGAHVILILDKHLQGFPWESCPALRGEAVSRMPSIWFLRDRILQQRFLSSTSEQDLTSRQDPTAGHQPQRPKWKDLEVDPQRTFYILNPAGDLKNTEKEFEDYVQGQEGWDGIVGRAPLNVEYMNALSKNELYIYFGHSGGEQYIKTSQIRQLGHCAVSLLLGCSSGSLKGCGEFDPTGNAMNYLLAGCPTLVANLWDVTDRDLDRFSKAVFSLWGLDENCRGRTLSKGSGQEREDEESMEGIEGVEKESLEEGAMRSGPGARLSIVEAVKEAREECRLKYLVGAASVVYGIPCFLKSSPRRAE
ncbi:hypothetical protein BGZ70_008527 [Mortierella alpina]|uniref:separase n=1 Tax=Mortierella alpina TaxID=64518 RepID=A0A9P6M0R8_MORAP|nr:hypothetical protein BGZ70_008527 [Mortierella alpina]